MRAALLPTPGDPFMLDYWLRNFLTWREHVDELVVCLNGAPPEARALVEAAGGRVLSFPGRIGHDGAIAALLHATPADHVVLCEDDAYVRHPDAVARAFKDLEARVMDIIGSPRHEDYASSPLQVWPRYLTDSPEELRRGLWPAFLFIDPRALLDTDMRFGDRRWDVGEHVRGWRNVTAEDCAYVGIAPDFIHLDTLFGTTFQLRSKAPRIDLVHHVRLFDAEATETWIGEDPPWFHVTGLSTLDEALASWPLPDMDDHGGLWTRRVAWWMRTVVESSLPGRTERLFQIGEFTRHAGMRQVDLDAWARRFDAWTAAAVPA